MDQGSKKLGSQQELARNTRSAMQQPIEVKANNHAHDGNHPRAKSFLQHSHGARQHSQSEEESVEESARVSSSSSKLRSYLDGRKTTRAADDAQDGGGDNIHRKADTPVTTTTEGRPQQRHRGAEGAGADPHNPQRVDIARGGREGSSTSALSTSESDWLLTEHPSVWDVGQPVTGLAKVDSASTMNGLLDREVRKSQAERYLAEQLLAYIAKETAPLPRS